MVKWIALLSSSKESTLNYVKGENHRLPNVPFEVIQKNGSYNDLEEAIKMAAQSSDGTTDKQRESIWESST